MELCNLCGLPQNSSAFGRSICFQIRVAQTAQCFRDSESETRSLRLQDLERAMVLILGLGKPPSLGVNLAKQIQRWCQIWMRGTKLYLFHRKCTLQDFFGLLVVALRNVYC